MRTNIKRLVTACAMGLCVMLAPSFMKTQAEAVSYPVALDSSNFPDSTILDSAKEYDKNSDGMLQKSECRSLSANFKEVGDTYKPVYCANLKGIEYFRDVAVLTKEKTLTIPNDFNGDLSVRTIKTKSLTLNGGKNVRSLVFEEGENIKLTIKNKMLKMKSLEVCYGTIIRGVDFGKLPNLERIEAAIFLPTISTDNDGGVLKINGLKKLREVKYYGTDNRKNKRQTIIISNCPKLEFIGGIKRNVWKITNCPKAKKQLD